MCYRHSNPLIAAAAIEAKAAGLRVIERLTESGPVYVVIRLLPGGRSTRIGERHDPGALRRWVGKLAQITRPTATH